MVVLNGKSVCLSVFVVYTQTVTEYLLMLYVYIFRMVYMAGDAEAHINPRAL